VFAAALLASAQPYNPHQVDGTMKVHNSPPAANGDAVVVGKED